MLLIEVLDRVSMITPRNERSTTLYKHLDLENQGITKTSTIRKISKYRHTITLKHETMKMCYGRSVVFALESCYLNDLAYGYAFWNNCIPISLLDCLESENVIRIHIGH